MEVGKEVGRTSEAGTPDNDIEKGAQRKKEKGKKEDEPPLLQRGSSYQ